MPKTLETKNIELPIAELTPSPTNPRKFFDPVKLQELADSIKEQGVLSPIWVRKVDKGYEIIAGERRLRASKLAGLETVPCELKVMDDKQVAELQIIENLQRDELRPLEEARAYKLLMDQHGYDMKLMSEKISKSQSYIYGCFRLLKLSPAWQKAMDQGEVKIAFAQVVAVRVDDHKVQDDILKQLLGDWGTYGGTETADELRATIEQEHDHNLKRAIWKLDDAELVIAAGACSTCPHRSKAQTSLFGDAGKEDFCTLGKCWDSKVKATTERLIEKHQKAGSKILKGAAADKEIKGAKETYGNSAYMSMDERVPTNSSSGDGTGHKLVEAAKLESEIVLAISSTGRVYKLFKRKDLRELAEKAARSGNNRSKPRKKSESEKAQELKLLKQRQANQRKQHLENMTRSAAGEMLEEVITAGKLIKSPLLKVMAKIVSEGMDSDGDELLAASLGTQTAGLNKYVQQRKVITAAIEDPKTTVKVLAHSIAWHAGPQAEAKSYLKALGVDWNKAEAKAKKQIAAEQATAQKAEKK